MVAQVLPNEIPAGAAVVEVDAVGDESFEVMSEPDRGPVADDDTMVHPVSSAPQVIPVSAEDKLSLDWCSDRPFAIVTKRRAIDSVKPGAAPKT